MTAKPQHSICTPSGGCWLFLRLFTHAAGGPSQQLLNEFYQQQTQQLQPQLQALPAQHMVGPMTQPAVKLQPQTASKPMSAQQAASRLAAGGSLQAVPCITSAALTTTSVEHSLAQSQGLLLPQP